MCNLIIPKAEAERQNKDSPRYTERPCPEMKKREFLQKKNCQEVENTVLSFLHFYKLYSKVIVQLTHVPTDRSIGEGLGFACTDHDC